MVDHFGKLRSAHLEDGWDAEPNYKELLKLDMPLTIFHGELAFMGNWLSWGTGFHGELDFTCRVEGVREAEAAFKQARKSNLEIPYYPNTEHGLNWGRVRLRKVDLLAI